MRKKPADSRFWVQENTAADVSWSKPQAFESSNESFYSFTSSVGGNSQVYGLIWHWHWLDINKTGTEKMKKLELFSSKYGFRYGEREMKHVISPSPPHNITWAATRIQMSSRLFLYGASADFNIHLYNVSYTHTLFFCLFWDFTLTWSWDNDVFYPITFL